MKIRDYAKAILVSTVTNITLMILTAIWNLLWPSINILFINKAVVTVVLTAFCIASLFFTFFIFWTNRNKFQPRFPPIEYDYVFEEFSFELLFENRKNIELKTYCHIKALKEVKEYIRNYRWSGSSHDAPEFLDNPHLHQITEHPMLEDGKHYKVVFSSPLYQNYETDFSIRIKCYDENCCMLPHHCFRVLKPTEKLTLRLIFNEDLVNTVNRGAYADEDAEIPLDKITPVLVKSESGLKIYEWVINKPSLLYYYRLDWTFKE